MILSAPKLTHLRDAEVAEAAATGEIAEVIAHWGYSFLRRDELLDIASWQSWREDPAPLLIAMADLRKMPGAPSVRSRVREAAEESARSFPEITQAISSSAHSGKRYACVFTACVNASRRLFPLKDDRDLVLSHVQAAVCRILCAAGHRLTHAGAL